jgi:antitoxin (DNA-binding transcriptional repressor) of toxin-antitoxin stability system
LTFARAVSMCVHGIGRPRLTMYKRTSEIPDQVSVAVAKDRISALVEKGANGERTVVRSRNIPIATIGPIADIERPDEAKRTPITKIKSGKESIKGILSRDKVTVITIDGDERASLYPARQETDSIVPSVDVRRLVALLENTQSLQSQYQREIEKLQKVRNFCNGLLEHSDNVVRQLPDDLNRDQLKKSLQKLREGLSVTE